FYARDPSLSPVCRAGSDPRTVLARLHRRSGRAPQDQLREQPLVHPAGRDGPIRVGRGRGARPGGTGQLSRSRDIPREPAQSAGGPPLAAWSTPLVWFALLFFHSGRPTCSSGFSGQPGVLASLISRRW